jgi:hypothetical protein
MKKLFDYIHYWRGWLQSGSVKKDILNTVLYFAKGYLLAVILMVALQRQLMYFPSKEWLVNPADYQIQTVTYPTADHIPLTSWYVAPKKNMPVFVLFHGNAGNISERAFKQQFFTQRGYGFLLAEYRGYGRNAGSPSENGLYSDARAAITWLVKTQKIDESRIILYGESIGSGIASQMAVEFKKSKALILEAPFTSGVNIVGDVYPWLLFFKYLTLDQYDNLSKAPYFSMPVLIVSGDHDSVIPQRHSTQLMAAVGSPVQKLVTLKGGDHSNLADFGLLETIADFIKDK